MPPSGPLAGLLVVDLSRALAGPHAAMMLGDLGARVIKVEAPGGDDSRGWGPPFVTPPGGGDPVSTYFLSCNRNKESIVLDLKAPDGREMLARLLERADVLVENFRTGVLERLGFGPQDLLERHPRLVVLSITGFGHDGPEGGRAGYDQIAQGEAGVMSLTGDEPTKTGIAIGDVMAGMYGAYGVLGALHERERTGRGQVVRTSLLAALVGSHAYQGTRWTVAREVPGQGGRHHASICPYGAFACRDGIVQIAVGSENLWRPFAAAFGVDRPEWAGNEARVRDRDAVVAAIENAFAPFDRAPLLARLDDLGIPAGQVRTLDEVYDWYQTRSQGLVVPVDHPTLGTVELPGPPLRFEHVEGAGGRAAHASPPLLDEHGAAIRAEFA